MRTCGLAIFSGASWDGTVSSPAKLRWSRNLKRHSRACRRTSKLARACCAAMKRFFAQKVIDRAAEKAPAIILFGEIEKAHDALYRLVLGILDRTYDGERGQNLVSKTSAARSLPNYRDFSSCCANQAPAE